MRFGINFTALVYTPILVLVGRLIYLSFGPIDAHLFLTGLAIVIPLLILHYFLKRAAKRFRVKHLEVIKTDRKDISSLMFKILIINLIILIPWFIWLKTHGY